MADKKSLVDLRRRLSSLTGKQRMDSLLDLEDVAKVVPRLPVEELYLTIVDVGLADSTELVHLASPEQFRGFVDLGAWNKDRIDSHRLLTWIRSAREDDHERFIKKLQAVDIELIEYMLREFTEIHDLEENPDVNPAGVTMESPEGKYLIEFKGIEGAELAAMRALLNDLITQQPFEFGRLLEAVRWEVPSELEETAYQFRTGRLQDLGFPPVEQALALFSRVPIDRPVVQPNDQAHAIARSAPTPLLEAAVSGLDEHEARALEQELRYLTNSVLVAEWAEPGDLDAIRRVSERTRDWLLLGLETLTGGDASKATDVVRQHELKRIFQTGFTQTLELKFLADKLASEPFTFFQKTLLAMPDETAVVEAIRKKRPLRALKTPGAEPVAFRSLRELDEARSLLNRVRQQRVILRTLLGGTEATAADVMTRFGTTLEVLGTQRLFIAALVQLLTADRLELKPAKPIQVVAFWERIFHKEPRGVGVREDALAAAVKGLQAATTESDATELREMVNQALQFLAREIGPVWFQGKTPEPHLVSTLLPLEGWNVL